MESSSNPGNIHSSFNHMKSIAHLVLLHVLLSPTTAELESRANPFYYYEEVLHNNDGLTMATTNEQPPSDAADLDPSKVFMDKPSTETFESYEQKRRFLETGLPTFDNPNEDYLFRDTREYLCQGVNEVRARYTTVRYTNPITGEGPEREYCATNGTELKATIEQGPDEMWVVVPRGRPIRLADVGSIMIRQGQTVYLRANNGTSSIDGGHSTRMFVVFGHLIVDTLVLINGKSNSAESSYTWTSPPIEMKPGASGGAVHLAGGRSAAWFVECTFLNNNFEMTTEGRDIWNEGELVLNNNNFAPGWDDAPEAIRNDGTIQVTPTGSWDETPFDGVRYQ